AGSHGDAGAAIGDGAVGAARVTPAAVPDTAPSVGTEEWLGLGSAVPWERGHLAGFGSDMRAGRYCWRIPGWLRCRPCSAGLLPGDADRKVGATPKQGSPNSPAVSARPRSQQPPVRPPPACRWFAMGAALLLLTGCARATKIPPLT